MSKPSYDPINKVWSGIKVPSLYNSNQSVGRAALMVLQNTPDSVAQISADTGTSLTCREFHDLIIKIAIFLKKCGLEEGDIVGFVAGNTENLGPTVFACLLMGLPVNPLRSIWTKNEIMQMLLKIKPKVLICDAERVNAVQDAVNEIKIETKILTVMEKVPGYECISACLKIIGDEDAKDFEFPLIDPNSTATILCSSGSTGFAKGICWSHKDIIEHYTPLWSNTMKIKQIFYQLSGIHWISGFYTLVVSTLYNYVRVTTAKDISSDIKEIQRIFNKYKVTGFIASPSMISSWIQSENFKPLNSIRNVLIGGAVVPETLCEKFKPFIPSGNIFVAYGSTETWLTAINLWTKNFGRTGYLLKNAQLMITDDNFKALDAYQNGEILTKQIIFTDYLNEPEKTKEVFRGEWYLTGDIGYFDKEGYFYVTGRKKELLKYNSYDTTPAELENIINQIEGVTSSCVVGVIDKNTGNDIIHAFVTCKKSSNFTEKYVEECVAGKVIDQRRIRGGVHFIESLPVGSTGKINRMALTEMAKNVGK